MLRRTIREDIEITFNRADAPAPVRGDASQIEQVVMNLVVNAQDAMPRGGTMTVEVANVVLDEVGLRAGPSLLPGPYVLLSVTDTGLGMDAETLAHIFEPFFTTKERGKGTGLGLATVYGIIRQHGGDVTVESEPDKGSTVRVYLPRASESASTDERTGQSAETPGGKETILVVEDDESVRRLTCSVLRAHGYTVLAADGGQSALALMEVEQAPVHLLLTDVVMPGINARETYHRLLAGRPGLKVLYMSGYTEDVLGLQGVLEEGVHLIGKPFTVEALTRKVREVLDREA
jgi:two-component system cell cycle sensor histidine kinase/response regulator CckA